MLQANQLIHAKWIISGKAADLVLTHHAIAIQNGVIIDLLPSEIAKQQYPDFVQTTYAEHALMPGLINTHTHLAMNYFRGLADDLSLMTWLKDYIWPAEKKWVSEEFVRDASLFAMAEMIRSGTTCFNDMYFFLGATAEAVDIAGVRGAIGITVIDVPTAWAQTAEEYIAKGLDFYHQYKDHPRIVTTLAPHAPYTVSDKILEKIKALSETHHLKINMHIHETADEVNQSLTQYNKRPLARLHELGLISPQLIAVHMTQINQEDLNILTDTRPNIVHCPQSNMKLASGVCPVTMLQSLGLNVALGTDGAASNNDLNMIGEMRTAAFLAKFSTGQPTSLSAAETFTLATLNGAKALGLDNKIGSLEIGKSADMIAVRLDEIETLPVFHPVSQVVYAASRNQVTDVWVEGKQLLKNRELLTLDYAELKNKVLFWQNKLSSINS